MSRLNNKTAVITGGGQGIGKAIALKLASEDANVAILDVNLHSAEVVAEEINKQGKQAIAIQCDVSNRSEVKTAFNKILETFGTIDILINNAGIIQDAIFYKMTEEQWDKVMAVNGKGLFNCTQEAYWIMRAKKHGKIVNISSTSSKGSIGQTNYAFSKAGVNGFTKSLAMEAGKYNINVNSILVGFIDTDMMQTVPEDYFNSLVERSAFKRVGEPKEVADLVCYLCSDEATWITGAELLCAGGVVYC